MGIQPPFLKQQLLLLWLSEKPHPDFWGAEEQLRNWLARAVLAINPCLSSSKGPTAVMGKIELLSLGSVAEPRLSWEAPNFKILLRILRGWGELIDYRLGQN